MASLVSGASSRPVYRRRADDGGLDLGTICVDDVLVILSMRGVIRQRSNFRNAFPVIVNLCRCFSVGLAVNISDEEESIAGRVNEEAGCFCCTCCKSLSESVYRVFVVSIGAI